MVTMKGSLVKSCFLFTLLIPELLDFLLAFMEHHDAAVECSSQGRLSFQQIFVLLICANAILIIHDLIYISN